MKSYPKPQHATKIKFPRPSKYGNVPKLYKGRLYHSTKERDYAMFLDSEKFAKRIVDWKPQYTLRLYVNGKHITDYIADFAVEKEDGAVEIHEVKGYFTPIGKLKWKLAQAVWDHAFEFVLIK